MASKRGVDGTASLHAPNEALARRIIACRKCPRLCAHTREVARVKRRAYQDETYWGRPVPSFGDPDARLVICGLAPGAHGANRTGRLFTGDSSGDWLYRALHDAGFANQSESVRDGDGLRLSDARVTCAVRCAPPGNRPNAIETDACLPYLVEELKLFPRLAALLALGRFAFDAILKAGAASERLVFSERPRFAHGAEAIATNGVTLLTSYHPSRQNTQTGRLTRAMFDAPIRRAREIVDASNGGLR